MNTLLRRFLIVLAVSSLVGLAFVPLGDSGWADGVRAERGQRRARKGGGGGPGRGGREAPSALARFAGPLGKETLMIGIPAGLVVLIGLGIGRLRR